MRRKYNDRGQALIEVSVFFLMLAVLLAALTGFSQWMICRQKLMIAVKEGALLYSSGHLQQHDVEKHMLEFLASGAPRLNARDVRIAIGHCRLGKNLGIRLDQVAVRYTKPRGWYWLLGTPPTLEEKCFVKHAPHYWIPF